MAMTRLRFLLTSILASLAACIPWGTKRLSREDFKVQVVMRQVFDAPQFMRWKAVIMDPNQNFLGVWSRAFDLNDADDMTACRMEIDDMVRIVIEQRLQALA